MRKVFNFSIIGLVLFLLAWAGPARAIDNPEQKASEAIKNYITSKYPDWQKSEIHLTFKLAEQSFNEMQMLPAKEQLVVMELYPDFRPVGNVIFPIAVSRTSTLESAKKYMLRVKVEVIKKIAVASKLIKKRKILDSGDIRLEERDVALLPNKYFVNASQLIGKEAKITIPQNGTIFEWMAGDLPVFHRGETVNLVVSGQNLKVRAKAQALEDGYLGAEIKARRKDSKSIVTGKVISSNEVEVKL